MVAERSERKNLTHALAFNSRPHISGLLIFCSHLSRVGQLFEGCLELRTSIIVPHHFAFAAPIQPSKFAPGSRTSVKSGEVGVGGSATSQDDLVTRLCESQIVCFEKHE